MKLIYKILWIHVAAALVLTIIFSSLNNSTTEIFFVVFGVVSLFAGLIDIPVSIVLFILRKKDWAKGFLLTSGVLLLLSGTACSFYL
jgi:hypothetical protein